MLHVHARSCVVRLLALLLFSVKFSNPCAQTGAASAEVMCAALRRSTMGELVTANSVLHWPRCCISLRQAAHVSSLHMLSTYLNACILFDLSETALLLFSILFYCHYCSFYYYCYYYHSSSYYYFRFYYCASHVSSIRSRAPSASYCCLARMMQAAFIAVQQIAKGCERAEQLDAQCSWDLAGSEHLYCVPTSQKDHEDPA